MNDRFAPPYLIAPRYLAGPAPDTCTPTVVDILLAAGWHADQETATYRDKDGMREACRTSPHGSGASHNSSLTGWEFTTLRCPGGTVAWRAHFASSTPPEIIADFATALTNDLPDADTDAGPHYLRPPGSPRKAATALDAAGWICDIGIRDTAWYAQTQQAVVVAPALPDPGDDNDGNWLCAARRAADLTVLWFALASPTTPTHLIAALCRAITDPTPVLRRTLPGHEVGELTIVHPN